MYLYLYPLLCSQQSVFKSPLILSSPMSLPSASLTPIYKQEHNSTFLHETPLCEAPIYAYDTQFTTCKVNCELLSTVTVAMVFRVLDCRKLHCRACCIRSQPVNSIK